MSEKIVPSSGTPHDKVLSKQQYKIDTIAQNMFSTASRKEKKVMVPKTDLKGVTVQRLWDSAFANGSDFMKRYHDRRGEKNLSVGPWEYSADRSNGYRFASLVTIVEVPRSGTETVLNEAHRFAYVNNDDGLILAYQISSQTPNVPAGSSFRTEAYCEITAENEKADCSIAIMGNCKKMSMAFTAIQYLAVPRALKEMTSAYKSMVSMIAEDLCGGVAVVPGTPDTSDEADGGGPSAEDGDDSSSGALFLGVLLVLAALVTLVLVWTMSSIRGAAREAALLTRNMRERESLTVAPCGTCNCAPHNTEEHALMEAARDAQLQTLRYRWLEQRGTIESLERSHTWMRLTIYIQCALLLSVIVKVFLL